MLSLVPRKVLVRLLVVLPELLHDVLAHVAVLLLDLACDLELVLGRHVRHLAALAHEVKHELGDVAPCDGNVLDRAPDHVPLRTGDDVRDTVAGVEHDTRGATGRVKREYGLDGDVECRRVERLKHDLRHLLAVRLRVERRLREEDRVLFGRDTQLVVEGVVPDLLHVVPVGDDTVLDRVLQREDTTLGLSLITRMYTSA